MGKNELVWGDLWRGGEAERRDVQASYSGRIGMEKTFNVK